MSALERAVGSKIALFRGSLGLSQSEFGVRTGFNQVTISKIEHGQRKLAASELWIMANELNVSIDAILGRTDHVAGLTETKAREVLAQVHVLTAAFAKAVSS